MNEWLPMLERIQPKATEWEGEPNVPEQNRVGSLAVGVIKSVLTVREYIEKMMSEAETISERWDWIKAGR